MAGHKTMTRARAIAGTTAALVLAGAASASAHHCYKEWWADAAYQHHLAGGTAWVPLSDLGTMFIIGPEYAEECGYVADDAVKAWMVDNGLTQEPLIHSKATVGSGSFYKKGKEPKPFSYLSEDDFGCADDGHHRRHGGVRPGLGAAGGVTCA